ncbi:hypothetical protein [Methylotuvimicrobium sp. KM2]|uniref:hypothetical protein n=1 Tax=Methylotuvimicrobium sp. KM2 TaxID=3133976 RepID=UPI0031010036
MKTILCMKWGTQYGADFVNQLYRGVHDNITGDFRFVCLTDDPSGMNDGIEALPLPNIELGNAAIWSGWRKLSSLSSQLKEAPYHLSGDILFLDIDLLITDSIDVLFDYKPGAFCIIENWTQLGKGIGNSSVYRYDIDRYQYIFDDFESRYEEIYKTVSNEQVYLTRSVAKTEKVEWWPEEWCRSFKVHALPNRLLQPFIPAKLPPACRVLVFHGHPKPLEALQGVWPRGKKSKRWIRPCPWVSQYWKG